MKGLLLFLALLGSAQATSLQRISAYNAVAAQTDSTPHLGYCKLGDRNYRLPHNAVALSPDLLRRYPCGTPVRVTTRSGYVYHGIVADKTSNRFSRTADLRFASRRAALRFGVQGGTIVRR